MPRIIFLIILLLFSSCSSNLDQANNAFLKQYGQEVARINNQREEFDRTQKAPGMAVTKHKEKPGWKDPSDVIGVSGTNKYRSAFLDTSKLKLAPPLEDFTPNMQTFLSGRGARNLPPDMFDVKYLAVNYPDSYNNAQISFDDIVIPGRDNYGVETSLGQKNYALINSKILQDNVDYINSTTKYDDREIRSILVREQKELDRKRKMDILKSKNPQKTDKKKEEKKEDENLSLDMM